MTYAVKDYFDILFALAAAFKPAPVAAPSQWAEENLSLPSSTSIPGPLRLSRMQATMIDAIAAPDVRMAALKLGAQCGKSLAVDCLLLHAIVTDPSTMLHLSSTDQKAKRFEGARLAPLLQASSKLKGLIRPGDSKLFKNFDGGTLSLGSSHKAEDLASLSCKYVFMDEVDRFREVIRKEGSPISIALARQFTYPLSKKAVLCSTPTDSKSTIHEYYLKGDQREFLTPCPECFHAFVLSMDNLQWKTGRPDTAKIVCPGCGHHITEVERREQIEKGCWQATATETAENGAISFHASQFVSRFASLQDIAEKYEVSVNSTTLRQDFTNLVLGEIHVEAGFESVNPDALMERAEEIVAPFSNNIEFIVVAIDIQKYRVEATWTAFEKAGVITILDRRIYPGDTSTDEPWEKLDTDLDDVFQLEDETLLAPQIFGIDIGYRADYGNHFVRQQIAKGRQFFTLVGRGRDKGKYLFERAEVTVGKNEAFLPHLDIGVNTIKRQIFDKLNMQDFGPGAIRFPKHLNRDYYRSLTNEHLVTKYSKEGYPFQVFERKYGRTSGGGNECLDLLVYSIALSRMCKPRTTEKRIASFKDSAAKIARLGRR